jgi:hypothetical protein
LGGLWGVLVWGLVRIPEQRDEFHVGLEWQCIVGVLDKNMAFNSTIPESRLRACIPSIDYRMGVPKIGS